MVIVNIGSEKKLYVDDKLYSRIQTKVIPAIQKRDNDWVWVVDGPERSGKSVFAMQLAKLVDPTFNIQRVCLTAKQFREEVAKANKYEAIIFDEAFTGLSSRASLSEMNRLLVEMMMEMGQKNLFIIIVLPTIFMLEKYVALFRAKGLFHIYLKNGKRGRWVYFNKKKKTTLYILGKKLFSYDRPRSHFRGRFLNNYMVDEQEYRQKKHNALIKKTNEKPNRYKEQRDLMVHILHDKLGLTQGKLSKLLKENGLQLEQQAISMIFKSKTVNPEFK